MQWSRDGFGVSAAAELAADVSGFGAGDAGQGAGGTGAAVDYLWWLVAGVSAAVGGQCRAGWGQSWRGGAVAGVSISAGFSAVCSAIASGSGGTAGAGGGCTMVCSGGTADGGRVAAWLFSGAQSEPCSEHNGGAFRFGCAVLSAGVMYWLFSVECVSWSGPAAVCAGNQERIRTQPVLLFGLCWIGCPMLAFSIAATKLPSYITPGYPGIVLVVASYLDRVLRGEVLTGVRWQQAAFGTAAIVCWLLIPGLLVGVYLFLPAAMWLSLIPVPLALASVYVLMQLKTERAASAMRWWGVSAAVFTLALFSLGVPAASQQRPLLTLLQSEESSDPKPRFAAWGTPRASWIYYADQQFTAFTPDTAEAATEFLLKEPNARLLVAGSQLEQLQQSLPLAVVVRKSAQDFPDSVDDTLCVVQASSAVAADGGSTRKPLMIRGVGVSR